MQKKFKNLKIIKEIFPFLWAKEEKVRSLFLISFSLILVSIFLNLSIPLILKEVVSKLSAPNKSMTYELCLLLLSYGIIWTLSQTIQQIRQIIMVTPLEKSVRLFCSKLFEHIHSLPMKFHLDRKTGALTNALERAQNGFPNIFWGLFLFVIPTIIEIALASLVLCYYYGLIYGLVLIAIAAVFIIFTLYSTEWASHFQEVSNEHQAEVNTNIVDSLLNFASVKYFNNKSYETSKCENFLKTREKSLVKALSSMELVRIGQNFIIGCGLVLLTYIAGKQTLLNVYNVSDFILINGYILQFVAPLSFMGFVARDIRKGLNDFASIMEIYNTKPVAASTRNLLLEREIKKIEFHNVSFGYEPSRLVLNDINFDLQAGKSLAIVGPTGSGKSTISNLIFGFYNPNTGRILINNQDIRTVNMESLYSLLGIVPQDIALFNTTIYENILYAHPNANKKEVEEVIELAHLNPVLEKLPEHYETIVGERGLKLSGGEKQRIAIARILLKRPSLYIFDEATSSLDLTTEDIIMKNIAPFIKEAASLIIAHRLSTVVNADEILVFNHGFIVERGSHTSLLKNQGFYASLWKAHEDAHKKSYAA